MKSADSSSKNPRFPRATGLQPFQSLGRPRSFFFLSCRFIVLGGTSSQGGYILVANHISHFDPPMIGCWFLRYVDWMAMEEYIKRLGALG